MRMGFLPVLDKAHILKPCREPASIFDFLIPISDTFYYVGERGNKGHDCSTSCSAPEKFNFLYLAVSGFPEHYRRIFLTYSKNSYRSRRSHRLMPAAHNEVGTDFFCRYWHSSDCICPVQEERHVIFMADRCYLSCIRQVSVTSIGICYESKSRRFTAFLCDLFYCLTITFRVQDVFGAACVRHDFDVQACSFGCDVGRVMSKPIKHNPVSWLSYGMHDSKLLFPCPICNPCLITAKEFRKCLVYE